MLLFFQQRFEEGNNIQDGGKKLMPTLYLEYSSITAYRGKILEKCLEFYQEIYTKDGISIVMLNPEPSERAFKHKKKSTQ